MRSSLLLLVTRLLLISLAEDEYQVLLRQQWLFACYEKILSQASEIRFQDLDQSSCLYFAQAFYKGANIYRRMATEKSLKRALYYHQKALEIRQQHMNEYALELAHSYADLGATYNELKGADNNTKAIELYGKALAIYTYHHDNGKRYVASTFNKLANAYRDLNDVNIPLASNYLDQALEILATLPHDTYCQRERAKIFYNQGVNYHRLGGKENIKRAIVLLHQAKELFERIGDAARATLTATYLEGLHVAS